MVRTDKCGIRIPAGATEESFRRRPLPPKRHPGPQLVVVGCRLRRFCSGRRLGSDLCVPRCLQDDSFRVGHLQCSQRRRHQHHDQLQRQQYGGHGDMADI
mmetsp:Transcript_133211/g.385476  ORF Transcript_133211/g.385476 Transcript_133211/m.385476 type:complete len:100 (-) Transcript_133211:726-1025(-)